MTMFFGVFKYGYSDIPSVNLISSIHMQPMKVQNQRKGWLKALTESSDARERICGSRHGKSIQRLDIKSSSGS
jgi:hypothetical protein